jgi:hypothetical protein
MRWFKHPDPIVIRPELKEILRPVAPLFQEQASSGAQGDALEALRQLMREAGLLA